MFTIYTFLVDNEKARVDEEEKSLKSLKWNWIKKIATKTRREETKKPEKEGKEK